MLLKGINRILFTLLFYSSFEGKIYACDICGCYMGITPYDNQSQISFLHRYRAFNGYRTYNQKSNLFTPGAYKLAHGEHGSTPEYQKTYSSKDYESYKTYELRVKYYIHKRIEFNGVVPFNYNKSKQDTAIATTFGIGDPNFFIGYHLIRKIEVEKMQQRLIVGAGIKIPSGNYYDKDVAGNRIPLLLQTGTGSIDYFTYVNYIAGYKMIGINLNAMYKFNGQNYYKEKIANSFSTYFNIFARIKLKNWFVIPSIQSYYEYTEGLIVKTILQPNTKMNALMLGPGLDVVYKNIGLNLAYQFCAYEEEQGDNLQNAGRVMVGLSYNFNQTKYLLNKKPKVN